MNKKALLVGINYPGSLSELRGCVNDVNAIESMITSKFGFSNIKKLIDQTATTQNILNELKWLVDNAQSGDILLFHYSGHGSQVPDLDNDESDRLDEIICPIDLDWKTKIIKDDDLKAIFSKVPDNVNLTVILDCCHSGDGIRGGITHPSVKTDKSKWLPTPQLIAENIQLKTSKFSQFKINRPTPPKGILISGCKSNQTSADAWIKTENKFMGACTYSLTTLLKKYNYNITYDQLVLNMNKMLKREGYTQQPQLNCNNNLTSKKFLG